MGIVGTVMAGVIMGVLMIAGVVQLVQVAVNMAKGK